MNYCLVKSIRPGLLCPSADRNDHSVIQVAIRLLADIKSVVFETQSRKEDKS